MRRKRRNGFAIALTSLLSVGFLFTAVGDLSAGHKLEEHEKSYVLGYPDDPSEAWVNAMGGRLYDNWISMLDKDKPEATHAAWPDSNTKKKGAVTWRCKSCHGWDFRGKDGAYSKGSYKTGIAGVQGVAGKDPGEIHKVIMNDTHGFTHDMIPMEYMVWLATFLSKGQYDITAYVADDGTVSGDAVHGKAVFENTCAACHGYDGTALDWGDEDEPGYVGTEANGNPWETFFKIRHGHPGVEMIAFSAFDLQTAADVLAYAKTLQQR